MKTLKSLVTFLIFVSIACGLVIAHWVSSWLLKVPVDAILPQYAFILGLCTVFLSMVLAGLVEKNGGYPERMPILVKA